MADKTVNPGRASFSFSHYERLKEDLRKNMRLHFFEEPEIQAVIDIIDSFDKRLRQKVLALLYNLSNTSSNVVPRLLAHMREAADFLGPGQMSEWLSRAFDHLDSGGLEPAVRFISKSGSASLRAFERAGEYSARKTIRLLEGYLAGITGVQLRVAAGNDPYTDTSTVFLPLKEGWDFALYKLSVVHKWAQIRYGTFDPVIRPDALAGLPERALALDLYNILEAARLDRTFILEKELPGLARKAAPLKKELFRGRPPVHSLPEKTGFAEALFQLYLSGSVKGDVPAKDFLPLLHQSIKAAGKAASSFENLSLASALCEKTAGFTGAYEPIGSSFLGRLRPEEAEREIRARQKRLRKRLDALIERVIEMPGFVPGRKKIPGPPPSREIKPEPGKKYLLIRGRLIELDEGLLKELEKAGGIPGGVLVDGAEAGEGHPVYLPGGAAEEEKPAAEEKGGGAKYDEWDYRRGGYRKGWCTLFERDVHPGREPFVAETLAKYRGYVNILRKKFELFRLEPRLMRGQKEGDDVDIDAVTEAFADMRAGVNPPEGLFVRLDRKERNIAVLFLVDMSGSTKGWVNVAEKEALVLMCEALEALGDRYAIYGFSGMTRNRCQYYRVKSFGERYGQKTVQERIAGISPKDYTRMGPAIRHSVRILKDVEARTKLLISLSDGKPEDYDAYKGDYGVEDTKKALIEAREQGIHSFCVTIDREAGGYLPHMYGGVNYIVIDDVRKLPGRMTEIYRRLTA
ncbi:MAG: VWA domain-containing protein [Nitrospiraceae bacterium]|nr:VWA domain-containing protein [Nitrospiraceae bacterium]